MLNFPVRISLQRTPDQSARRTGCLERHRHLALTVAADRAGVPSLFDPFPDHATVPVAAE